MSDPAKESHLRSILKAFTWRIVATSTTATIAYFIIGDVTAALTIGGIEFFVKMFVYYLHERAWQVLPRGSVRKLVEAEDEAPQSDGASA